MVVDIKLDEKCVFFENSELMYDYLVVVLGYEVEIFGIKGLKEYVFIIMSINVVC